MFLWLKGQKSCTYKTNEKNISEILNIDENLVGLKQLQMKNWDQKEEEGISCHSVVLLRGLKINFNLKRKLLKFCLILVCLVV